MRLVLIPERLAVLPVQALLVAAQAVPLLPERQRIRDVARPDNGASALRRGDEMQATHRDRRHHIAIDERQRRRVVAVALW